MKKLLSVILSVVMAMSAFSVAFAAESDGVPTVFDVSENNYYLITEENYDPDGIVFTGNNSDTHISIETNVDIIFRDLLFGWMDVGSAESVDITLEGDNTINSTAGVGISTIGADVTINAVDDASLTVITNGYFISDNGHKGSLTVNGGNIDVVSSYEGESCSTINVYYTQNGGNVTCSAKGGYALSQDAVLNGGTLTVSSEADYVGGDNITIAQGALLKATSPEGILELISNEFIIAESAPENSYFFAKTSADGEFVLVKDAEKLKEEKYLELKVDVHEHSLAEGDCVCGLKKADYSGYDAATDRYNKLTSEYKDVFVEEAKDYISAEVQKIVDEYLGGTGIKNNYTDAEQYILDGVADGINEICDTIEEGIADGTFIKPDYSEIEAKIAGFEKTHAGEEYKAFIAEIKADLAAIKASEPKNHADIADGIAAIEAKINAVADCDHMCHQSGIMGFFWKIVNFFSKLFGSNPVCECGIAHY